MIKGLDVFKGFFHDFQEQYVLIGGAACDIVFNEANVQFRATKDFDMVLLVEALTLEFGRRFWDFIREGGYENRAKSNGAPQFFRFDKPKNTEFPHMIELFAKSESVLDGESHGCKPLHLGDELSSLSAILLNDDYYQLLLSGKTIVDEVPVLPLTHLALFKAKAWLNLTGQKADGRQIHDNDIRKHKNDIARIAALLSGNESLAIPSTVREDMAQFIEAFEKEPPNIKALGIANVSSHDIANLLNEIYLR